MHLFDELIAIAPTGTLGLVHADGHGLLPGLKPRIAWAVQPFKPAAAALDHQGLHVFKDFNALPSAPLPAIVFVAIPKNMDEARGLLAQSLSVLATGGLLAASAANDAGGKRLAGLFKEIGLGPVQQIAKRHARLVWAQNPAQHHAPQESVQKNAAGFWSQPGLFSWDRLDVGSALLMQYIPENLNGCGADFGCGYGALAAHVLQHNPGIKALDCIDADARALNCCALNCHPEGDLRARDDKVNVLWRDLTEPQPDLKNRYDWIIMNPPFHEGKIEKNMIGQRFIAVAAQLLKPGGRLYMVANVHLPYEEVLHHTFDKTEIITQKNGFKIIMGTH